MRYNREDSALSDALGAVVLISVVALGITIAGMAIISSPHPEKIPAISSDIITVNRTIYLSHNGGDSLKRSEMQIVVDGQDYTNRFTSTSGAGWSAWSVGDYLNYTVPGEPTDPMPRGVSIYYLGGRSEYLIQSMGVPSAAVRPTPVPTVSTPPTPVPPLPVAADFSGSPTSGNPGLAVTFIDKSTGPVTSWSWDFGDGSTTSTLQNPPVHQYLLTGRYRVTLTVGNGSGYDTKSVDRYITVNPSPLWYNCLWGYRKNITVLKSKVTGTQTNFPVLISLTDNDLKNYARSDGYDILFTASDGTTVIPHEIAKYTPSTGGLIAWVQVPTVTSTANTTIYLYYGNSSSPDMQNKDGVWDTNYKAVWHLDEGGIGTRYDSTSNANNAIPRKYDGSQATSGQICGADRLHRSLYDYLESTNNIGITGNSARTISFWANLDDTSRNGMVGWGANVNKQEFEAAIRNNLYFLWGYGGGNDWDPVSSVTPSTGNWHYHTITYDGTNTARWYIDGSQISSTSSYTYSTPASHVFIGNESDTGMAATSYLKGVIDEIRISGSARSANWIATEYTDQESPATFAIPGSQESWYC